MGGITLRILHTADWHLGKMLEGRSRFKEQMAFADELVSLVNDQNIDLVLIAGDIYDTVNPPALAEQLFYETLYRLADHGKRAVAVIAGNHDQPERLSAADILTKQNRIWIKGSPTIEPLFIPNLGHDQESVWLAMLPYPSEARLKELISDDSDDHVMQGAYSTRVGELLRTQASYFKQQSVLLAMSHLYVHGGLSSDSERPIQLGGSYTVEAPMLDIGVQYFALGHLHRAQTVAKQDTIRYSGSPLAYSFSEAGQAKSVTVIEVSAGEPAKCTEIFLTCGRPLVKWQARYGFDEVIQWIDKGQDTNAWVDLEIHLETALSLDQIHQLRKCHEGLIHIRPIYLRRDDTIDDRYERSQLPLDELFRRFYQKQTGGAIPEDPLVHLFMSCLQEEEQESKYASPEQEGGEM